MTLTYGAAKLEVSEAFIDYGINAGIDPNVRAGQQRVCLEIKDMLS
jgi:hypothetical protein